MEDVPGIRPDKAEVVCSNCGYEFEPVGNPNARGAHARVQADCPECPSGGWVIHNKYGYIGSYQGALNVSEK